jgi:hypothetical protein
LFAAVAPDWHLRLLRCGHRPDHAFAALLGRKAKACIGAHHGHGDDGIGDDVMEAVYVMMRTVEAGNQIGVNVARLATSAVRGAMAGGEVLGARTIKLIETGLPNIMDGLREALEETRREAEVVKKTAMKRPAAAKGGAGMARATAKRAPAKKSAPAKKKAAARKKSGGNQEDGASQEVGNQPRSADARPRVIYPFQRVRNTAEWYYRGSLLAHFRACQYLHLAGKHPIWLTSVFSMRRRGEA